MNVSVKNSCKCPNLQRVLIEATNTPPLLWTSPISIKNNPPPPSIRDYPPSIKDCLSSVKDYAPSPSRTMLPLSKTFSPQWLHQGLCLPPPSKDYAPPRTTPTIKDYAPPPPQHCSNLHFTRHWLTIMRKIVPCCSCSERRGYGCNT